MKRLFVLSLLLVLSALLVGCGDNTPAPGTPAALPTAEGFPDAPQNVDEGEPPAEGTPGESFPAPTTTAPGGAPDGYPAPTPTMTRLPEGEYPAPTMVPAEDPYESPDS